MPIPTIDTARKKVIDDNISMGKNKYKKMY
jgi:hypothetical protein